ncbi:thioesterase family protein [Hyphomonas sp. FCG-A18]|uniref:thioesterase family protein n=1 Tax=Hyphomonas sp. FCG-A18 TaxID=3080019 RepID=UPI002B30DD06|nr:thioesterase family protein [Hyphomonas sp. FCG-A18]
MIPLWSGSANTWDCDEMGHMNVRVYVEKAMEGLGSFAAAIAMPHAYREKAPSTLMVAEHHVRFIREVHPGRPLSMHGCVLEWDETSALLYQDMRHSDGTPSAAFRTRLFHVDAKTGKPFPWSTRSKAQLEALKGTAPDDTKPRGLDPSVAPLPSSSTTLETVAKVGALEIGRGTVPPQHCDIFGRMLASWFMGRISDSVPNLLYDWRKAVTAKTEDAKMGAAVLEYRLIYRKWPRAGDRFVIHSALADVAEKTHTLSHWVMDPDTGEAWMTSEAVAVTFDLNTRKVIPTPPEQMAALETIAPRGLQL